MLKYVYDLGLLCWLSSQAGCASHMASTNRAWSSGCFSDKGFFVISWNTGLQGPLSWLYLVCEMSALVGYWAHTGLHPGQMEGLGRAWVAVLRATSEWSKPGHRSAQHLFHPISPLRNVPGCHVKLSLRVDCLGSQRAAANWVLTSDMNTE